MRFACFIFTLFLIEIDIFITMFSDKPRMIVFEVA